MILPIAIPISTLIASFLFFQSMSRSQELTALRSSGLSIYKIILPSLTLSFFLSLFSFSMNADIVPFCKRESKHLIFQETSSNPLLLLQRQKLLKIKHAFLKMDAKDDETMENLIFITPTGRDSLSFISAKRLWIEEGKLEGKDLAVISYIPKEGGFDTLFLENQSQMQTSAKILSQVLKKKSSKLDVGALSFKMLFFYPKKSLSFIEALKRISLSISSFTFTLLGAAFAIEQGRSHSKKKLLTLLFLALFVLASHLLGKEFKHQLLLAASFFIFPHLIVWFSSFTHLKKISEGYEPLV